MLSMRKSSLAPPNTPKRFWGRYGVSHRPWNWREAALQRRIIDAINQGFVDSAHDFLRRRTRRRVAEAGFRNGMGAQVELKSDDLAAE